MEVGEREQGADQEEESQGKEDRVCAWTSTSISNLTFEAQRQRDAWRCGYCRLQRQWWVSDLLLTRTDLRVLICAGERNSN